MAGGEGVSIAGPSSVCLVRGRACLGVCTFSLCSSGVGVCVRFLSFALLVFAQRCKRPKHTCIHFHRKVLLRSSSPIKMSNRLGVSVLARRADTHLLAAVLRWLLLEASSWDSAKSVLL